jgi:hypothetical protein
MTSRPKLKPKAATKKAKSAAAAKRRTASARKAARKAAPAVNDAPPVPPAARRTKNALAVALSPQQLGQLFARLANEPNLTVIRVREIAHDEYGIDIELESATKFLQEEFHPHLEQLNKATAFAHFIAQHAEKGSAATLAASADALLQMRVFEFLSALDDGKIDLSTSAGQFTADTLSRIVARGRAADTKTAELEHKLKVAEAELQRMADEKEAERKRLDDLTSGKTKGMTTEARNAIRRELGLADVPATLPA